MAAGVLARGLLWRQLAAALRPALQEVAHPLRDFGCGGRDGCQIVIQGFQLRLEFCPLLRELQGALTQALLLLLQGNELALAVHARAGLRREALLCRLPVAGPLRAEVAEGAGDVLEGVLGRGRGPRGDGRRGPRELLAELPEPEKVHREGLRRLDLLCPVLLPGEERGDRPVRVARHRRRRGQPRALLHVARRGGQVLRISAALRVRGQARPRNLDLPVPARVDLSVVPPAVARPLRPDPVPDTRRRGQRCIQLKLGAQ
mmetsp:Transcript_104877/g.296681  ORF Transcript_104877/g.296681 Transcript_104877/m.296681 type:complete len:260 (-) Transcript_104877:898-1677(-)